MTRSEAKISQETVTIVRKKLLKIQIRVFMTGTETRKQSQKIIRDKLSGPGDCLDVCARGTRVASKFLGIELI